ncbi:hypothetical protein SG2048 [Sodalis glossinidius str. 'morsitans']|uniref:Secreted effector protein pipB2 n=1 Tax=Sodalis glossinidius (strain morsitans) TaxID=343509 RepID=Q2NRA2_SODGM|nr:hypothetical protein SG2048 [Sodalis glossinidius str. 'morsitans']
MQGAQCEKTNFKGANLQGAWCQEAKFNGADLQGALCHNTYLAGADLRDIAKTDSVLQQYIEKTDKKRTEDIRALCDKIVKAYEKDNNGKVEHNNDGVFRKEPAVPELNDATASLNRGELDIEKVGIHVASTLIKREFKAEKPLDKETFARIGAHPEQALQLFLDRFAAMTPETGKRCHMILATFAAAYDNADNDNASESNKGTVLSCAADTSLFNGFFALAAGNRTTTYDYSERILRDFILYQKVPPPPSYRRCRINAIS